MFLKRVLTVLIVVSALSLSILACGPSDIFDTDVSSLEPTSTPTSTIAVPEPDRPEEEEPTETPEPSTEGKASITALSIVDPDEPGLLYSPEEGKHLVSIEVVIENKSDESISVNPLDANLIDNQGFVTMVELGSSDTHDQIETLDLYPGERIQGWISFKIEDGASPAKLKYELDMWTGETLEANLSELSPFPEWQKISLNPNLGGISIVSDYSLTAWSVVDPSPPGSLYTPEEGLRLISVDIIVKNWTGSDQLSVNPLYAYLVDDYGFVYAAELGSSELGQIDTLDLSAGEAATGYVTFEVPEGRAALYLRYVTDFWGSDDPLVVSLQ